MDKQPTPLAVTTEGLLDIEVRGASVEDDQMQYLLNQGGVFHALDQDGRVIELSRDMDMESLDAQLLTFERTAPPFVVGSYQDHVIVGEPIFTDSGKLKAFDGQTYAVVGREPFDALRHIELLPVVAHALRQRLAPADREFVDVLHEQSQLELPLAVSLGRHLIEMATQHRRLCAIDLATGLDASQKGAQDALEARLDDFAQEIPGVTEAYLTGDPRGSTMGLRFENGTSNSLTGSYKIPTDDVLYAVLEKTTFWEQIKYSDAIAAPSP